MLPSHLRFGPHEHAAVQFRFGGEWYVAVAVKGRPKKLGCVYKLMHSRPLELGWLSKLRAAAKGALAAF